MNHRKTCDGFLCRPSSLNTSNKSKSIDIVGPKKPATEGQLPNRRVLAPNITQWCVNMICAVVILSRRRRISMWRTSRFFLPPVVRMTETSLPERSVIWRVLMRQRRKIATGPAPAPPAQSRNRPTTARCSASTRPAWRSTADDADGRLRQRKVRSDVAHAYLPAEPAQQVYDLHPHRMPHRLEHLRQARRLALRQAQARL